MELHTIGIDLGKPVFHLVGLNVHGEVVVRKKFSRTRLLHFTANRHIGLIGKEDRRQIQAWPTETGELEHVAMVQRLKVLPSVCISEIISQHLQAIPVGGSPSLHQGDCPDRTAIVLGPYTVNSSKASTAQKPAMASVS